VIDSLISRWRQSSAGRWYAGREPGEQKVVALLTAVTVLTVLWLGIWQPVAQWRAEADNRYQNAQATMGWLTANESRLRGVVSQGGNTANRSRLRLITQAANARGLKLNRVQPEGDGSVSVVLQDQSFNDVLAFTAALAENNGIAVSRASIDGSGTPGRVNAQIRFQ
jgi:general secretion pathway protein M